MMKQVRELWPILLLVVFGAILRLHNVLEFSSYNSEIAQHYLETIKLLDGKWLLDGPLTSHPWLRLSSAPYYLFFPVFALFRFHPLTLPILWTVTNSLIPLINFIIIKKVFDKKTAYISTFFLAISPGLLILNDLPGFFDFIIPLTYILLLFTYRVIHNRQSSVWPIFLVLGFMVTLHASAIILIPLYVGLVLYLKRHSLRVLFTSTIAFCVPNIPYLLNDMLGHFQMTAQLALWLPYKTVNFFSGKSIGLNRTKVPDSTLIDISNFFKNMFLSPEISWIVGLVIFSLFIIVFVIKKKTIFESFLYMWLIFAVITMIVHKNPPYHYFVPIILLPTILASKALSDMINTKWVIFPILALIALSDFMFIFSPKYFFRRSNNSYVFQMNIAQAIIKDSGNNEFSVTRIGEFDYYPNQFKDNYEYLLWWLGKPANSKASIRYIIIEKPSKLPEGKKGSVTFEDVKATVIKEE
ncbi:hypothetical protein HGB07_09500 [Candidatus Roizmanbacteria bacterium]|nr:hypothetical protein [Candidatus Roizmanbacteria bacterium]